MKGQTTHLLLTQGTSASSDAFIVKMQQSSSNLSVFIINFTEAPVSELMSAAILICVMQMCENKNYGGGELCSPSPSFFFWGGSLSLLNLLKVGAQRALGAGQPTLQMAGGSEAVSTLKRAKSRGFSPAGEDTA